MAVPPPIQSRMYQEMSNGMLGFNNAMKIHDTPFPFPWLQIVSSLLLFLFCGVVALYVFQNVRTLLLLIFRDRRSSG